MAQDLTNSSIQRQNILNNPFSMAEVEKAAGIRGIPFEGRSVLLKEQVVQFFGVSARTVENYLSQHEAELARNGYEVVRASRLKSLKKVIQDEDVTEINFGNINKSPQLGIFDFRAFLNLSMLMVESERAKLLRKLILDIAIDTINARSGGGTKYINQRDEEFIGAWYPQEVYRKRFTDALRDFIDLGNFKYPLYTNRVYVSIFKENADEYRKILKLNSTDKLRDTLYAEVLDLIASYEYGFAETLRAKSTALGRKLYSSEVDQIFVNFESLPHCSEMNLSASWALRAKSLMRDWQTQWMLCGA